ncbi:hypothetical protein SAMN04487819_101350 [Actinopolyspora alba]|uniref:Uncharacterized protein n=1 Tax=Actinopolyspora alba TaxID=673379 RepID=A0A1I1U2I9_9ACTN|nr:hypothetical protein [Actinopolyspora alba]SFD62050.1 hypothetical protein SAMN04487819_101350 [Actinopolyspora alba]
MFRRASVGMAGVVALTIAPTVPAALATAPATPQMEKPSSTKIVEKLSFTSSGMELSLGNQNFVIPLTGSVIMDGAPPVTPGQTTAIDIRNLKAHSVSPEDASPRQSSPAQRDLGRVRVEQNAGANSSLTMTQQFPPRFVQSMLLDLNISIENPPEGLREQVDPRGTQQGPLVLTTKNPAQLVGELKQFPPRGAEYESQEPVELVPEDDQSTTIGRVLGLPVMVDVL